MIEIRFVTVINSVCNIEDMRQSGINKTFISGEPTVARVGPWWLSAYVGSDIRVLILQEVVPGSDDVRGVVSLLSSSGNHLFEVATEP